MESEKLLIYDLQKVRDAFGKSEKDVLDDVEIVRNWLRSQPHLPEITSDTVIESFLRLNKFSIERTKQKLDMYYTIRSLIPEMYESAHPRLPHMQQMFDSTYYIPLPKLTKELYRIIVLKMMLDPEDFSVNRLSAHALNLVEVRLHEDAAVGDVYIIDDEYLKMGHLVKISPMHLKKVAIISETVFSSRIKAIHVINGPPFQDLLMKLAKTAFKQKIIERIHHHTPEELSNYFPKEILPKDYGGYEKSLHDLNELWRQKVGDYNERFDDLDKMRVKEDLRPEPLKNDEVLGYHGNFKKLDID